MYIPILLLFCPLIFNQILIFPSCCLKPHLILHGLVSNSETIFSIFLYPKLLFFGEPTPCCCDEIMVSTGIPISYHFSAWYFKQKVYLWNKISTNTKPGDLHPRKNNSMTHYCTTKCNLNFPVFTS